MSALKWQPRIGAVARSAMRERARAPLGQQLSVSVESVPLVAVESDTLAPSGTVVLGGQAAASPTVAAQTVKSAGATAIIMEAFEVA